jgi:hypothetical protein
MQLKIFLDINSYEFFLRHLSLRSRGWAAINRATLLGSTRIVECDSTAANELLIHARESYPAAVTRITEALGIAKPNH